MKDDAAIYEKSYYAAISADNDDGGELNHMERMWKSYRFKKVQPQIIRRGQVTQEMLAKCLDVGITIEKVLGQVCVRTPSFCASMLLRQG